MKAVRVVGYHENLKIDDIPEPQATGPFDVVVRIGAAGVCRTDLHILEGQWAEKSGVALPYTIGHENAGWVHAVGTAVTNVREGDKVILHPLITCGLCRACRSGDDVHCESSRFPGIDTHGGYAEYLVMRPNTRVYPLPDFLSIEDAVFCNPLGSGFDWAVRLAGKSPVLMRLGKDAMFRRQDRDFADALEFLRSQLTIAFSTEDIQEGVKAFFEKRDPEWTGR